MSEPNEPVSNVSVNGQPQPWLPGLDVATLLQRQGQAADAVATALNGHFVPRDARPHTLLQPGDQLTVFQAIVGG
jgi:sulfur carrier protein